MQNTVLPRSTYFATSFITVTSRGPPVSWDIGAKGAIVELDEGRAGPGRQENNGDSQAGVSQRQQ